jgi:hypothetical protein
MNSGIRQFRQTRSAVADATFQYGYLGIEIGESLLELLAISSVACGLYVMQHPSARQEQPVPLAFAFQFLG